LADMNLSYISNVENGQNNISIIKFCQLCNALLVPSNDVLQKACQQLGVLRLLIRNRTPRAAVLLLRQNSTISLEISALIKAGTPAKDPTNNDQNPNSITTLPTN
jgi:transcriptional regulator with XRE-family HTH domain